MENFANGVRISFPFGPRRAVHVANTTVTTIEHAAFVFCTAMNESACIKAGCRRVLRIDAKIVVSPKLM
jgi:hypothetical protein